MTGAVILKVDAAMRGNKVIYWLGRIPLVKKLVSDTLYEASEGKLALSVILWAWRILKSFAGTFLYLAVMCVLPLLIVVEPGHLADGFGRFCWLLLWLSFVAGGLLNPFTVEPDQLKYTCIRMMGMDARRFHLVQGGAYHLEYFITFAAGLMADGVFDQRHGHVQRVQAQQLVDAHAPARGDVVDDDAVLDGVNIHCASTSIPSSFRISAMRMYLPLSTCLK